MRIPFAIHSYLSRAPIVSQQRLVNGYTESVPEGSKGQPPIYGTPGVKAFATVGTGPIRGGMVFKESAYVVSGTELYRVKKNGLTNLVGTIPGSDRVFMTAGNSLVIVGADSLLAWYTDDGVVLDGPIDSDNFQGSNGVAWLGGYYIYPKPETDVFYVSAVENPNDIDALDFASAEALPDLIVAVIVDHNDLILFGSQVSEIWTQRGGTFPFLRLGNGVLEYGCIAKHSPAKIDNTVCWLAHDKTIRALRENIPTRISTEGVEYEIGNYSRVDDAIGLSMTVDGRSTYTITFPTAMKTWQYSFNTGLWNELESYGKGRWQIDGSLEIYGKTLVWDDTTNRIGELDTDVYDEWGDTVVYKMVSAPVHNGNKWLFHNALYLDFEMGVEVQKYVSQVTATITGITRANPAVVTTAANHGFDNGNLVFITGVVGMTEVNDNYYRVANKTDTTFELQAINSSGYTAYGSVGTVAFANERDALVMIRWSNDGKNWGPTYQRSLGAIGKYSDRIALNQNLGRAKNRVYEVSISDPVKRHFLGAEGEIQVGSY